MATETSYTSLFSYAIRVEQLDSHAYRVNLNEAFCIGSVPNGGYTASCMLAAANTHLASRDQGDTLTAHFEFPYKTTVGAALITIDEVKIGRQISTLQLTLWQGALLSSKPWVTPNVSRRTVLGYTTHANLHTFTGISLPTGYESSHAANIPSVPDFSALRTHGVDKDWEETKPPKTSTPLKSLGNWRSYIPHKERLTPGVLDMWVCMASGERITQASLAYVVDSFPFNLHLFLAAPSSGAPSDSRSRISARSATEAAEEKTKRVGFWFPTVVMNIEAKTLLPREGVEWLAVRVTSKQIRDGRFDLDVMVRDTKGNIVALSHQVALILDFERNTGTNSTSVASL